MYSFSSDQENYTGEYPTREEAIQEAVAEGYQRFWTAENREPATSSAINGRDIIEWIQNTDDFCIEQAESWPIMTNQQEEDLTRMMRAAFEQWMKKHSLKPTFWLAENVREHYAADHQAPAPAQGERV